MDEQIFYKQLVERYASRQASPDELMVFFQLLSEGKLDQYLDKALMAHAGLNKMPSEQEKTAQPDIKPVTRNFNYKLLGQWALAACFIAVASLILFLLLKTPKPARGVAGVKTPATQPSDIPPGGNRATLTLADGSSILLDKSAAGQVAQEREARVIKRSEGLLAYELKGAAPSEEQSQNTLATPRGGQYQVSLSDGTKVWLNAESALHFPAAFNAHGRTVQLEGEAYFEVAADRSRPFVVQMKTGVNIQVLGTHFNISGYAGEQVKTTLLQGSVRVKSQQQSAVLKAGQEAVAGPDGALKIAELTGDADAPAWKNGLFEFNRADVSTIMRQIERWYDVSVEYKGEKSTREFVGKISRNSNLSEVLGILELNGIHFKTEGRKVIVSP